MPPQLFNKHKDGDVPWTVYIGRGSPWGNPYVIGKHGTREQVVELHRRLLLNQPELVERAKRELAGKDLLCFCAPLKCHGETWLRVVNTPDWDET